MQYHYKTQDFLKLIPAIVKNYNSQKNSVTQIAPKDVNKTNQDIVWRNTFGKIIGLPKKKIKFPVGTQVLISRERLLFEKRTSNTRYSPEVFIVRKAVQDRPANYYFLSDLHNEELIGTFYEPELTKVDYKNGSEE
jgi:hypothetical protein